MSLHPSKVKLTKRKVDALPAPTTGQKIYWDTEQRGFGVRVTAAGAKSYVAQGRANGHTRRVTLAPVDLLGVDDARVRARRALLQMHDGVDITAERKRKAAKGRAQEVTLREIMGDYLKRKRTKNGPLRSATKESMEETVTARFPDWLDKPVASITRSACAARFDEVSKTAPGQANLAFRYLRALLNWARETHATEEGEYPLLAINPVTQVFKKGTTHWNPENRKNTLIPLPKVGEVWAMLAERRNPDNHVSATCTSADLVAFLLLTGARIGEAQTLTWDRVKLDDEPVPTLHFDNTKNHNPVTLPVSTPLHALLQGRYEQRVARNPYVFPSRSRHGHLSDVRDTMRRVSELAGLHLTPHDLRRTFLAIAFECGVEMWRAELLTNHVPNTVTLRHYTETSNLRYLAPESQRIAEWIVAAPSAENR